MKKDVVQIGLRVPGDLAARLEDATDRTRNPLAPNLTQIVRLGIELALKEMEKKTK